MVFISFRFGLSQIRLLILRVYVNRNSGSPFTADIIDDPDATPFSPSRDSPADFSYSSGLWDDISGERVRAQVFHQSFSFVFR